MTDKTFTFRLDAALKDAFERAAAADDMTAAQLLRRFMRTYVASAASAQADLFALPTDKKKKSKSKT